MEDTTPEFTPEFTDTEANEATGPIVHTPEFTPADVNSDRGEEVTPLPAAEFTPEAKEFTPEAQAAESSSHPVTSPAQGGVNSPAGAEFTPAAPTVIPDPITVAVVSGGSIKDKIINIWRVLDDPDVKPQRVLDILAAHGHKPTREHVSRTINRYVDALKAAEAEQDAMSAADPAGVHTADLREVTPEFTPPAAEPARLTSDDTGRNERTADMPAFTPEMEAQFEADFAVLQQQLRESARASVNNGRHAAHGVNGTAVRTRAGVADRPWSQFTPATQDQASGVHAVHTSAPSSLPEVTPEFTPDAPIVHTSAGVNSAPDSEATLSDLVFTPGGHTQGALSVVQGSATDARPVDAPIADDLEREYREVLAAGRGRRAGRLVPEPHEQEPGAGDEGLPTAPTPMQDRSRAVYLCYVVALMTLGLGLNTSWRFFDTVFHITNENGERYVMFALAEVAMVVFGVNLVASVRRTGKPGAFQPLVWGMCAGSGYMAWAMSTDSREAVGRIIFGPVLGTIALHAALGLEKRARHGAQVGMLARIGRELRERFLSRFGLADDARDAAQRTQDRAIYRAATLSMPRRMPWTRQARLERAIRAGKVADDDSARQRLQERLRVLQHASELAQLVQESPWDRDRTPADAHR